MITLLHHTETAVPVADLGLLATRLHDTNSALKQVR